MRNLSNWRSVRIWETQLERGLRQRHRLWLHGWCIGLLVWGAMWATAYLQMVAGSQSLALRYLITLGIGYLIYLLVLRVWASLLLRRQVEWTDPNLNIPSSSRSGGGGSPSVEWPSIDAGGGGDFGGGGASADFSGGAGDAASSLADVASGALDVAAGADEAAVVVVPVVAIFLMGLAAFFGAGFLLMYFGWDALMAAAVELAFSYVAARTAVRVTREGWLSAVIRLTWKPLLGALVCAVALGALIDFFVPTAHSLPQAVQLLTAKKT